MQETARLIYEEESLAGIEGRVAGMEDLFRITRNAELQDAERRYLPAHDRTRAVILAASQGDLGELTRGQPKCMVDIRGKSLLRRLVEALNGCGVRQVTVVRGYGKDAVALRGISVVDNDRHAETGEAFSLAAAAEAIQGQALVCYGDVLVRGYILDTLLTTDGDIVLAVDALGAQRGRGVRDLVAADRRYVGDLLDEEAAGLIRMGPDIPAVEICGEWMGLAKLSPVGATLVRSELALLREEGLLETADLPLLLTRLAAKHPVKVRYFTGNWLDVNTLPDLAEARNFT
jgi:phosphoenolpyruvate phosphomutase